MRCSFNVDCERLQHRHATRHRPSIGGDCGCPFPNTIAELAFTKGQHLFHQGDAVRGAFSLTSGLVALERVDEDGQSAILRLVKPGGFFPCADLFTDGLHGTAGRALTDVSACFVPAERLLSALAEPGLRRMVTQRFGEEARASEDVIFRLCSDDLAERLLAIIEALADVGGGEGKFILMPLSWRDVAAMAGTSPEVISRLLKRLAEAGRLTVSGRKVRLYPGGEERRATG